MGYGVLVIGESGAGKSTSMREFGADELSLVNVNGKMLPFRGRFTNTLRSDNYDAIMKFIKSAPTKSIVVDDCQYLLANEFMRRSKESGYQKFTDMATGFWNLVRSVENLPDDVIVYFLGHTATDENGVQRFKTVGKLLDEKITIEGMFTTVLHAVVSDGNYCFATQSRGDTAKSPMGLFDDYLIPNDLKMVDEALRVYYGFQPEHTCADCGNAIMPESGATVEQIVEGTTTAYGRKLCMRCARLAKAAASEQAGT